MIRPNLNQFMGATNPALNTGGTVTFVTSVMVLIIAFFPNLLTEDQYKAVFGILVIILPTLTGFLIRSQVWSPASVATALHQITLGQNIKYQETLKEIKEQSLPEKPESFSLNFPPDDDGVGWKKS